MIYEQIPDIVTSTVRAIYGSAYVDLGTFHFKSLANIFDFSNITINTGSLVSILSAIGFMVSAISVVVIAFVVVQRRALKMSEIPISAGSPKTGETSGMLRNRWSTIIAQLDSPREADWKIALLEADMLTDDALARAGFPGATFGDRLSNINPGTLVSLDGAWWAHKIRNRLAHEADYFLRYTEARQAVGYYQAVLTELNLL